MIYKLIIWHMGGRSLPPPHKTQIHTVTCLTVRMASQLLQLPLRSSLFHHVFDGCSLFRSRLKASDSFLFLRNSQLLCRRSYGRCLLPLSMRVRCSEWCSANDTPCFYDPLSLGGVKADLHPRMERLEHRLMVLEARVNIDPQVRSLLEVLPNLFVAYTLEQVRITKESLVKLRSDAFYLEQILLNTQNENEICSYIRKYALNQKYVVPVDCYVPLEEQIAEEEKIEMLLNNYLQRCNSCHDEAGRLLYSAKELEDSIFVNASSWRLEARRVKLLLQVGAPCVAVGALVVGMFGMNLKSYLKFVFAFGRTTAEFIFGAFVGLFVAFFAAYHL